MERCRVGREGIRPRKAALGYEIKLRQLPFGAWCCARACARLPVSGQEARRRREVENRQRGVDATAGAQRLTLRLPVNGDRGQGGRRRGWGQVKEGRFSALRLRLCPPACQ